MELNQLASKPQLVKIVLDDKEILDQYKEPVEFWCYDRQPIAKFVKFAVAGQDNFEELITLCEDLILDKDGKKVLEEGKVLPAQMLMKAVNKVVEILGK